MLCLASLPLARLWSQQPPPQPQLAPDHSAQELGLRYVIEAPAQARMTANDPAKDLSAR